MKADPSTVWADVYAAAMARGVGADEAMCRADAAAAALNTRARTVLTVGGVPIRFSSLTVRTVRGASDHDVSGSLDAVRADRDFYRTERDAYRGRLADVERELEIALAKRDEACASRNAHRRERDIVRGALAGAEAERNRLDAFVRALAITLDTAGVRAGDLLGRVDALIAERDAARAELAAQRGRGDRRSSLPAGCRVVEHTPSRVVVATPDGDSVEVYAQWRLVAHHCARGFGTAVGLDAVLAALDLAGALP